MPGYFRLHPPSILRRWIAARRTRRDRHQALRVLRGMSDWQLADIGIAREQITEVAAAMAARGGRRAPADVTAIDTGGQAVPSSDVPHGTKLAA